MSTAGERQRSIDYGMAVDAELDADLGLDLRANGTDGGVGLQQFASERLAAHRRRRVRTLNEPADPELGLADAEIGRFARRPTGSDAARSVQEVVAKRYEASPSYHEFLAAEAERALQQAHAEAEVAAQPRVELAGAIADIAMAATELMGPHKASASAHPRHSGAIAPTPLASGLTVQLYEELGVGLPGVILSTPAVSSGANANSDASQHADDQQELDAEIAFRQKPEFGEFVLEPVAIPANVIEFPRQIVAPRKARPRRAEGPLLEERAPEPQLRIFEVEAEQISAAPAETASAPEWQSMVLEAHAVAEPSAPLDAQLHFAQQPQTARLGLRLMATAVDACCVGLAFTSFVAVVVKIAGPKLHALPIPLAGGCAAAVFLSLVVAYQLLFFSFADATPGMRYARIGLCTFGEAQPSRAAMRRRIGATLLAACPLGLGLAWAWMDEDRLGWHDRMSRMYPRAY